MLTAKQRVTDLLNLGRLGTGGNSDWGHPQMGYIRAMSSAQWMCDGWVRLLPSERALEDTPGGRRNAGRGSCPLLSRSPFKFGGSSASRCRKTPS